MKTSSQKKWTIKDVLVWTESYLQERGFASPRLDSEIILAHVLETTRVGLYTNYDQPLGPNERQAFRKKVVQRANGIPVAYITGVKEFWSLPMEVAPGVLIPRPETEHLVEDALKQAVQLQQAFGDHLALADVGTGSGCIAVALATELPHVTILATDISPKAIALAGKNANKHGASAQVDAVQGDLLSMVKDQSLHLILSNPPYIPQNDQSTDPFVLQHEPTEALIAGPDGLSIIKKLLPEALRTLMPGGMLIIEFGCGQHEQVAALAPPGLRHLHTTGDLAGIPRIITFQKEVS